MRALHAVVLLVAAISALPSSKKLVVENGAICENKASAFFVVDNTQLSAGDNVIYKDFSEEECLNTCTNNRDPFGRSILCSSFVYDHISFTCTVFKDKSKPEGNGEKTGSVGKRYFEKFCLSENVPIECADGQFLRVDNSVLVGFASNVSLADTLEDCVALCVLDKACKSAMFFHEEGECITNTESAMSRPNSFAKEDTEKVIYFQNGCLAKKNVHAKNESKSEDGESPTSEKEGVEKEKTEGSGEITVDEHQKNDEDDGEKEAVATEADEAEEIPSEKMSETSPVEQEPLEEDTENAESEENDAEEEPTETSPATQSTRKHVNEKTQIIKFTKHPRNFGSKTVRAYKEDKKTKAKIDETRELSEEDLEPVTVAAASQENEEAEEARRDAADADALELPQNAEGAPTRKIHDIKPVKVKEMQPHSYLSEWTGWTPCSKTGERRIRRRKCLDLRKCLGALMQVENCPAVTTTPIPEDYDLPPLESVRSVVPVPTAVDHLADQGASPVPLPPVPTSSSASPDPSVWSPWLGVCQQFASGQPCNNGEMIGFESRECVAKEPSLCSGPFFRYCTLTC